MDVLFWLAMLLGFMMFMDTGWPVIKEWRARKQFRKELESLDDFPVREDEDRW